MDPALSSGPIAKRSRALVLFVLGCVLGSLAAASASGGWEFLGPSNIGGRVLAIAFHPTDASIVYSGSAGGGLWKSEDGGDTWFAITDELPSLAIGGVAVSPIDPNVVVIGTGEATLNVDRIPGVGALRSTDAGLTWSVTSLLYDVAAGHGFHFVETNPLTGTFLAGATDGLWRSSDAGATWTLVKPGADYFDAKWKPTEANVCYAARGSAPGGLNGIKISTDDGITWSQAGTGQPLSFLIGKAKIAVTADDPEMLYVIYSDYPNGNLLGVYRSTDGGSAWELRSTTPNIPGGQGWYNLSLAADPDDASILVAGGVALYRSPDGGVTWVQTGANVHVDHHAAVYEPGSTESLWVGTDGGAWKSSDDGLTWVPRSDGQGTSQFHDISVAQSGPDLTMGGTQDNGLLRRIGDTTEWELSLGGGVVCEICPTNENLVYASGPFGSPFRSVNGGETWTSISNGITGTGRWVPPLALDPTDCSHLYTATSDGVFRTKNGGSSWEHVWSGFARSIDISPVVGDIVWVAGGAVWLTTDHGGSWSQAVEYGFPTGGATRILADPVIHESAFVTFSGYSDEIAHIALTTDLGASWTDVSGDFPPQPVHAIAIDPDHMHHWYVGTDVGVWIARNGGWNWNPYGADLPNTVVVDLEIRNDARKLVAATHGRGVWQVGIATVLGADGAIAVSGASGLVLDPPSPNPAQDSAVLRFAAKHDGPVTLEVIDVQGRLVHRVLRLPGGDGSSQAVTWRWKDLPNGVYFVVLSAGEKRISRKLVVTR